MSASGARPATGLLPSERDAVWVHVLIFTVVGTFLAALVVHGAAPETLGAVMLGSVLAYHVAFLAVGRWRGHRDWLELWRFVLPLSVFQVLPDAFLARVLGVLEFPLPGPSIGPVDLFMAGLWAPALFLVVFAGDATARRRGPVSGALAALGASAGLFVGSEALLTRVPVWRAVDVHAIGPVALYVIGPELLLGLVTWLTYHHRASWQGHGAGSTWRRAAAAAALCLLYLGALAASYLLIDGGSVATRL
ncbi:MAG: hypothetical protein AAGC60_25460 [Acidobacteriota bacterium]